MSFDLKDLDKWANNLGGLARDGLEDFFEQETKKGGLLTLRNVKKVTRDEHTDTGNMLKSWRIDPKVKRKGKVYSITVFNNARSESSKNYPEGAPYPFYIEHGRRIVRNGKTVGYKRGFHILEDSKKEATKTIQRQMAKVFKTYAERELGQ